MSSSFDENANCLIEEQPNDPNANAKEKETCPEFLTEKVEKTEDSVEGGDDKILVGDQDFCPKAPKPSQTDLSADDVERVGQFKVDFPVLVGCLKKELEEIIQNAEEKIINDGVASEVLENEENVGEIEPDFIENDILKEILENEDSSSSFAEDKGHFDTDQMFEVVEEVVKQFNQMKYPNIINYIENDILQGMDKDNEQENFDKNEVSDENSSFFTKKVQSKDMKITMSMSKDVKENEVTSVPTMKPSNDQNEVGNFNDEIYFAEEISPEMRVVLQLGTSDVVGFLEKNQNRLDSGKVVEKSFKVAGKIDPNDSSTNLIKFSESTEFLPSPLATSQVYTNLQESQKIDEEQFQRDAFERAKLACGASFDSFEIPKKVIIPEVENQNVLDNLNVKFVEKVHDYDSEGFEVDEDSHFGEKDDQINHPEAGFDDEKVDDFVETELEIAPTIPDVKLEEIDEEHLSTTPRFVHERILVSSPRIVLERVEEPSEVIGSENQDVVEDLAKIKQVLDFSSGRIEVIKHQNEHLEVFENSRVQQQADANEYCGESGEKSSVYGDEKEAEEKDHEENEEFDHNQNEEDGNGGNEDSNDKDDKDDKNPKDFKFEKDENVNQSQSDEEGDEKSVKKDLGLDIKSGTPSGQLVNNNASDLGSFPASDLKIETPPNEFIVNDIPSNQVSENSLIVQTDGDVEKSLDNQKVTSSKSPSTTKFEEELDDFASRPLSDLGSENYRVSTLYGSKSSQSSAIKLETNAVTTQSDQNLPEPEIFEIVENWLQNSGEEMEAVPSIDDEPDVLDKVTGEKLETGQMDDFEFEKFKASKARLERFFDSLDQMDDDFLMTNDGHAVDSVGEVDGSLFAPGHGSNDSVVSSKKSIALSKAKSKSLNPKEMWNIDLDSLKDDLEDTKKSKGFSWSKYIPCMKTPEDAGSPQVGQSVLDASGGGSKGVRRGRRDEKNGNEDGEGVADEVDENEAEKKSKSLRKRSFSIGARLVKSRGRKSANNN